jgi:hypothetical protein
MSYYVIYSKESTAILKIRSKNRRTRERYNGIAAAKAALTRYNKAWAVENGKLGNEPDAPIFNYAIAEAGYYAANIERMVERVNMMSGKKYMESINTEPYMSPSSETYWSM